MVKRVTRAYRCYNPGNLRKGNNKWQGLSDDQLDPSFISFKAPKWGFRALAVTLITYQDKRRSADGSVIDTVREIISRWAPTTENNTEAYIRFVCKQTGFAPDQPLDLHKLDHIRPLIKAITTYESGDWIWQDEDLDTGLRLAGILAPQKPLGETAEVRGGSIAAASTGATAVLDQLQNSQDMLYGLAPYVPMAKYALLAIIIISVLYIIWSKTKHHITDS